MKYEFNRETGYNRAVIVVRVIVVVTDHVTDSKFVLDNMMTLIRRR